MSRCLFLGAFKKSYQNKEKSERSQADDGECIGHERGRSLLRLTEFVLDFWQSLVDDLLGLGHGLVGLSRDGQLEISLNRNKSNAFHSRNLKSSNISLLFHRYFCPKLSELSKRPSKTTYKMPIDRLLDGSITDDETRLVAAGQSIEIRVRFWQILKISISDQIRIR